MAVDCGIPEHPVEPRHQPFIRHVRQPIEVTRERVLEQVFGERSVAHPALEEPQERTVVFDQHVGDPGTVVCRRGLIDARLSHLRSIGIGHGRPRIMLGLRPDLVDRPNA